MSSHLKKLAIACALVGLQTDAALFDGCGIPDVEIDVNTNDQITRWVRSQGTETNDCRTALTACTFSRALSLAPSGSLVLVESGPYSITEHIKLDKSLVVRSFGGIATIDAAENDRHVIIKPTVAGPDIKVFFEGIVFLNGNGQALPSLQKGGGSILVDGGACLTLRNCVFRNNHMDPSVTGNLLGGAVHVSNGNSSPLRPGGLDVDHCLFTQNTAQANGGAIGMSSPSLRVVDSTFEYNSAGATGGRSGGAVWVQGKNPIDNSMEALILRSSFQRNVGEGVVNVNAGFVTVDSCTFTANTLASSYSASVLIRNGATAGTATIRASSFACQQGAPADPASFSDNEAADCEADTCTFSATCPADTKPASCTATDACLQCSGRGEFCAAPGLPVFPLPSSLLTSFLATTGSDSNPCSSAQPCKTLVRAINSIDPGGVVRIRAGTYAGANNVEVAIDRSITIEAEDPSDQPIFDGEGTSFIWTSKVTKNYDLSVQVTVKNIHFKDGFKPQTQSVTVPLGGAAFAVDRFTGARFEGCKFTGNRIVHPNMDGAAVGVHSQAQGAEFVGCTFTMNHANGGPGSLGGAIMSAMSNVIIDDCVFDQNYADSSTGGVVVYGRGIRRVLPQVKRSTFTQNSWRAISFNQISSIVSDCTFEGNMEKDALGFYMQPSDYFNYLSSSVFKCNGNEISTYSDVTVAHYNCESCSDECGPCAPFSSTDAAKWASGSVCTVPTASPTASPTANPTSPTPVFVGPSNAPTPAPSLSPTQAPSEEGDTSSPTTPTAAPSKLTISAAQSHFSALRAFWIAPVCLRLFL